MTEYRFLPDELAAAEAARQAETVSLIASENYASAAVRRALTSAFHHKYSEGYPGRRYYAGQTVVDEMEAQVVALATEVFQAEHANVQPLSGAAANLAVYASFLQPGDTVLAMDLSHGGHLTHGHPVTLSAKLYDFVPYKISDVATGKIDYAQLRELARECQPKLIVAGFSSYPGELDYAEIQDIANEVGARSMADVAHIAGLIAARALPNPMDFGFDYMTMTTHKTLRGPRGGLIVCRDEFAKEVDRAVFPGVQGGPHMNSVLAKGVALAETQTTSFQNYAAAVLENAQALSRTLQKLGVTLVTGQTKNHLMLVDTVKSFQIGGRAAQDRLEEVGIDVNMNVLPDDTRTPADPSGIRLGTPAITTRGAGLVEMVRLGEIIVRALSANIETLDRQQLREEVREIAKKLPVQQ